MFPAGLNGTRQFRTVRLLAALDFDELADQLPGSTVQVACDRLLLSLKAEAAAALPVGTDRLKG